MERWFRSAFALNREVSVRLKMHLSKKFTKEVTQNSVDWYTQDKAVRFADLLNSTVHILVVMTLQLRIPTTPDIISSHIYTQLFKKKKKKKERKKKKRKNITCTNTHVIKGLCDQNKKKNIKNK